MHKLLIADDEPLEREALRLFVEESHLDIAPVLECASGGDAVRIALLEKPDIVLLDINMPGMNGLEVLERIRVADKRAKVVISSAYDYFEYAKKAMQLDSLDFLVKPVSRAVLIAALTKAVDELDAEETAETRLERLSLMLETMEARVALDLAAGIVSDEALYCIEALGLGGGAAGVCFHARLAASDGESAGTLKRLKELLGLAGMASFCAAKDGRAAVAVFFREPRPGTELAEKASGIIASVLGKSAARIGTGTVFDALDGIGESFARARADAGETEARGDGSREEREERGAPVEVARIRAFIDENYAKKIGLDDIARAVGGSKYHICRLFKQNTGSTILDCLVARRMERARGLLREGDYSVKQISAMVGYADPNYFTWTFKKIEGVSPLKYRYSAPDRKQPAG